MAVKIVFRQSLANHKDAGLIQDLISDYSADVTVKQLDRLTGGFSGARVYLAVADVSRSVPTHWILKLGDGEDLEKESNAVDLANATPASQNAVSKVYFKRQGIHALLVYQFAGHDGRKPLDLMDGLLDYSSDELLTSVVEMLGSWAKGAESKTSHVTKQLHDWTITKLPLLADSLKSLERSRTIYVPELGRALANPSYYLSRRSSLRRIERRVPFGFTHGDLNLRNVLFPTNSSREPNVEKPLVIDFRHAGTGQWAFVDFAKLEASIRHSYFSDPTSDRNLGAHVAFFDSSSSSLALARPPEVVQADTQLQRLWRHISRIRSALVKSLGSDDWEDAYWATLSAYAISFASYDGRTPYERNLAFLDAATIFSRYFQKPDLSGSQAQFILVPGLSPELKASVKPSSWSAVALAKTLIAKGDAILVVGPGFGKPGGVESLANFLRGIHRDLGREPPPTDSTSMLLASLDKSAKKTSVVSKIRDRVSKWSASGRKQPFPGSEWSLVVHLHFHSLIAEAFRELGKKVAKIDTHDDISTTTWTDGCPDTIYFPFFGDAESSAESFAFSPKQQLEKLSLLEDAVELVRRRLRPISIVFWRCEEVRVEDLVQIRARIEAVGSLDAFFVSDQEAKERDQNLDSVGIVPVRARIEEVLAAKSPAATLPKDIDGYTWRRGETIFSLPPLQRLTHGILAPFDELRTLNPIANSDSDFLLGAPANVEDIEDGRVLLRPEVDGRIIPAIEEAVVRNRDRLRWVFVGGRPGAGISTCLVSAAHRVSVSERWPVFVLRSLAVMDAKAWKLAGELLADVSKTVGRPVIVFAESTEIEAAYIGNLAEGFLDCHGEAVFVVGGRTSDVNSIKSELELSAIETIDIADSLPSGMWSELARLLRREGYSLGLTDQQLANKMRGVGLLLPAIYEGTDKQNRKFREIVALEYHRYAGDQLVQRAYRLVCTAGVMGLGLSQYWLLKAVGGAAIARAAQILQALASDIVVDKPVDDRDPDGERIIRPRHRLIADTVLEIAVPDKEHRLSDIRSLIFAANLSTRQDGRAVTRLLGRRSPFREWLRSGFGPERECREVLTLFQDLLGRAGISPNVEVTLRQHYALTLRRADELEQALEQATLAYELEPLNAASAHVLGLVYETKALTAWRSAIKSNDDQLFGRGLVNEQEAKSFFQMARERQPTEEYGYEAEARYLRRKNEIFSDPKSSLSEQRRNSARSDLARGLRLLHEAEIRVHPGSLRESSRTKILLLSQMGDYGAALHLVDELIHDSEDSVAENTARELAATLAKMNCDWKRLRHECLALLAADIRSPYVYLLLDDALDGLGEDVERRRRARESAEDWNRDDIEALLRWCRVLVDEESWAAAESVLRRGLQAAQRQGVSLSQQLRRRGSAKDKTGRLRRVVGRVVRRNSSGSGFVQPGVSGEGPLMYFWTEPGKQPEIGDEVSFHVTYRLRGLLADDLEFHAPQTEDD